MSVPPHPEKINGDDRLELLLFRSASHATELHQISNLIGPELMRAAWDIQNGLIVTASEIRRISQALRTPAKIVLNDLRQAELIARALNGESVSFNEEVTQ